MWSGLTATLLPLGGSIAPKVRLKKMHRKHWKTSVDTEFWWMEDETALLGWLGGIWIFYLFIYFIFNVQMAARIRVWLCGNCATRSFPTNVAPQEFLKSLCTTNTLPLPTPTHPPLPLQLIKEIKRVIFLFQVKKSIRAKHVFLLNYFSKYNCFDRVWPITCIRESLFFPSGCPPDADGFCQRPFISHRRGNY